MPNDKISREYLKYYFDETELKELGENVSRETQNARRLEGDAKDVAAQFKSKIETAKASINRDAEKVCNGYELRAIECNVTLNCPKTGKKSVVRVDTGEIVRIENMTGEDMQLAFESLTNEAEAEPESENETDGDSE